MDNSLNDLIDDLNAALATCTKLQSPILGDMRDSLQSIALVRYSPSILLENT